jgi:hypothetical protein
MDLYSWVYQMNVVCKFKPPGNLSWRLSRLLRTRFITITFPVKRAARSHSLFLYSVLLIVRNRSKFGERGVAPPATPLSPNKEGPTPFRQKPY